MFRFQEIPPEGDPSGRIQEFQEVLPRLLCCRYWWMDEWKSQQMAFPYWRLYWNRSGAAWVVYNKTIHLESDKIILIPPNTPFSTGIENSSVPSELFYSLKGGRVESIEMEEILEAQDTVLHMSLLFSVLHQLPPGIWENRKLDDRVLQGIRQMEQNKPMTEISNKQLASTAGMSVNAYARLFKEQTGYSPRKYLRRMRVEKSCNLLHHSDLSIEQIASACGFSDRYYFTRVFSNTMEASPGEYRKNSIFGT